LEDLARIARTSLRELSDGRETTDVILNCYFRMSDVVADRRNLQRGLGMTPAEFASRLEEAGLPGEAVRRLTRLFESVRYGDRRAGPKEVNEAVACLTTILQYCGEAV
jgi:Lon protease-like protein